MENHNEPELRKALGGWQIALYGLGSMLGAGIYALIGKAAGQLGNALWLAFLAAMIAALLTGLTYASLGSRYPKAGGASYVTGRAFRSPLLGYVVGICVTMSGLTSMAGGSRAMGDILHSKLGVPLDPRLIAAGIVLLIGLLIYRGMRESLALNVVCTVVEALGLLFIIAVGMKFWGSVDYMETPARAAGIGLDSAIPLALILQGAVLTFFSFIGFEDILNVSEEVKRPSRDIPFGLLGAMVVATLIYLGVAITAVSVVPWQELAGSAAPLMDVAKKAAPWFGGIDTVYIVISLFAIANTALLNYIMGSRLLYGMSRQGLLPKSLGRIHPVRRTPHVAVLVLYAVVTGLLFSGGVKALAESTVLLLLLVFAAMNVALIILKLRSGEPEGGFSVPIPVPVLGALVCLSLIVVRVRSAWDSKDGEAHIAPLVAAGVVAAALGLYFLTRQGHKSGSET